MHAYGQNAREVSNEQGRIVWTSEMAEGGEGIRYMGFFYTDAGNGWIYDQQALYGSETVAYTTDGHKVDVDITLPEGSTELALVVDDAGDGYAYDHGDWINPVFVMKDGTELPITGEYIKEKFTNSFYNTINENVNVTNNGKMKVLGTTYNRGFSMDANAMILFRVPEGAVGFRGMGALDDSGIGQQGSTTSIRFYVFYFDPRTTKGGQPATADVSCDLTQFGYDVDDDLTVYDVWSGEQLLTMKPGVLTRTVKSHGVHLLRIVSAKQSAAGIKETKRPFDQAIQDGTYTLDGRQVSGTFNSLSRGLYVVNGKKYIKP